MGLLSKPLTSLRHSLSRQFLLAALFPLVITLLSLFPIKQQLREHAEINNYNLASSLASQVNVYLNTPIILLTHLQVIIDSQLTNGREALFPELQQSLNLLIRSYPLFESIYLLNDQHKIVTVGLTETRSQLKDDYIGLDLSDKKDIFLAREQGSLLWSNTALSVISGKVTTTITVPLQKGYTLQAEIQIYELVTFLNKIRADQNFSSMIIDKAGHIIAHTNSNISGNQLNISNIPLVLTGLSGTNSSAQFTLNQKEYLGSVIPIPDIGWAVIVSQTVEHAYQTLNQMVKIVLIITCLAFLLVTLLAFFMARRISLPFKELSLKTRQISQGNYQVHFKTTIIHEFNELESDLELMQHAIAQREDELRNRELEIKTLIDSTNAVPWHFEFSPKIDEGRFTFMGRQIVDLLGYPLSQWNCMQDWSEKIYPEDRERVVNFCQKETLAGRDHSMEYRFLDAKGEAIWVSETVSMIYSHGKISGMVGFIFDISAFKSLEEKMQNHVDQLDEMVSERTTELQQKVQQLQLAHTELIQSEKMASLGRLVAGFAHEINTPIGIAVGGATHMRELTRTLRKMGSSEEIDEESFFNELDRIDEASDLTYRSLERAGDLIRSFKRTSIDQSSEAPRYFEIKETILELLKTLDNLRKGRPIKIETFCDKCSAPQ